MNKPATPEDLHEPSSNDLDWLLSELQAPPVRKQDIIRKIEICKRVLGHPDCHEHRGEWANTIAYLGNCYFESVDSDTLDLLEGIRCQKRALEYFQYRTHQDKWAKLNINICKAFSRLYFSNPSELSYKLGAITHGENALTHCSREKYPFQWSELHYIIGRTYLANAVGTLPADIELARQILIKPLETIRANFPRYLTHAVYDPWMIMWGKIHRLLSVLYRNRIGGEFTENIELSIDHCMQSLEIFTREGDPYNWAGCLLNLANAFSVRKNGTDKQNLEQAISLYHMALKVLNLSEFPSSWASANMNLGVAYMYYCDVVTKDEKLAYARKAKEHLKQALQKTPKELSEFRRGILMMNLGEIEEIIERDRPNNFFHAISFYQNAQTVFTKKKSPLLWAALNFEIGECILGKSISASDLQSKSKISVIEDAISHVMAAINNIDPFTYSSHSRNFNGWLAKLFFSLGHWDEAVRFYKSSANAAQLVFDTAYTDTGRKKVLEESQWLHNSHAYCLIQLGNYEDALDVIDRGKALLLRENLNLTEINSREILPKHRGEINQTRQLIRELEAEMWLPPDTPQRRSNRILANLLKNNRIQLARILADIQKNDSRFMPMGIGYQDLVNLSPENGAIVIPIITMMGSIVLVIPHGVDQISEEHIVRIDEFKEIDLKNLLYCTGEEPGWQAAYMTYLINSNLNVLQSNMDRILEILWNKFIGYVVSRLIDLGIKDDAEIIIMPSGGLQLLPLHAAYYGENGERRYFNDSYSISYAPSGSALKVLQHRLQKRKNKSALIIGVGTYSCLPNLPNSPLEARMIASHFEKEIPLIDSDATIDAIMEGSNQVAYFHLSCHGNFAWGENPLESSLYLADGERITLAHIISRMNFDQCRLVTLSACETGVSGQEIPDEFIGLPAGFIQAGSGAVLSSLWAVDDLSTALLMERFYCSHLDNGMTMSASLRQSQIWLKNANREDLVDVIKKSNNIPNGDKRISAIELIRRWKPEEKPFEHPFYWAPFNLTGS
ncbi:MAG: CHAT domain-containing protein [Chloroflexi bacterium]|nr:CHAT domain-containing protein [Chloroflexota bacterium]